MNESSSRILLTLLKEGKRLQDIVEKGAQLLKNPIMFADCQYQPQAFSSDYPADDIRDRIHAQTELAERGRKAFDKVADPIPFLSQHPAFRRHHLVCKAIWNDRWIGTLMIPEMKTSLTDLDYELVRMIADACAIAGVLELESDIVDQRRPVMYVFNDLIDERIPDAAALEKRLAGSALQRFFPYRVIHVYAAEFENDPRYQSVMTAQLRPCLEVNWIFRAQGRVFLLCEGEQLSLSLQSFLNNLHRQYGFLYGVSDCAHDLWRLKWMVQEAVTTTRFAVYAQRDKAIHVFDDYKFYAIADLADPDRWETYLTDNFKKILNYDKKNKTEYLRTIQVYLINDANIQKASEALFVHKNTLVYRLKRIRELFGVDLEVNKELLKLYFSFALYKLHQFRSQNLDS